MTVPSIEGIISHLALQALNSPQVWEALGAMCADFGHHSSVDVAIDALDALKGGHLTKDQAMAVVKACLEDFPSPSSRNPRPSGGVMRSASQKDLSYVLSQIPR